VGGIRSWHLASIGPGCTTKQRLGHDPVWQSGTILTTAALVGLQAVERAGTLSLRRECTALGITTPLVNLLPKADPDLRLPVGGTYVGEGLLPVGREDPVMGVCRDGGTPARVLKVVWDQSTKLRIIVHTTIF